MTFHSLRTGWARSGWATYRARCMSAIFLSSAATAASRVAASLIVDRREISLSIFGSE